MGFVVITIVGAILGWLATGLVRAKDRAAPITYMLAGALGALAGALAGGKVPLSEGVSAQQLVWGGVGALLAIACVNVIRSRQSAASGKI